MNIAIAGYGLEGKASYQYWSEQPGHSLTIVDEHPVTDAPEGVSVIYGEGAFSRLNGFGLVVRTASLSPRKITTDGVVWSATNEFFKECPAPVIGVTGTKGKGTTSSLIASILQAAGKTVHLLGNIGVPALSLLKDIHKDDVVVFELSSYQLWDLEQSPHVAVVLLIEPDHLNVHDGMDDYVGAKAHIAANQGVDDVVIYHPTNHYSQGIAIQSSGVRIKYGVDNPGGVYVQDDAFWYQGERVCDVTALQLIGQHNIENACAAITAVKQLGVANDAIKDGLEHFSGLPHRLEFVREFEGVAYYNDSFSSAPSATCAAIRSFTQPELLILGGVDKGADFTELSETLRAASNIKAVFVMGEIREKLGEILTSASINAPVVLLDDAQLSSIVHKVKESAESGDVIILSPACASFDMFKDFYDRGDQFRSIVKELS